MGYIRGGWPWLIGVTSCPCSQLGTAYVSATTGAVVTALGLKALTKVRGPSVTPLSPGDPVVSPLHPAAFGSREGGEFSLVADLGTAGSVPKTPP